MNIAAAHPHLFNTPKTESVQDVDHVKIMKLLDEKNHVIAQSVFKNGGIEGNRRPENKIWQDKDNKMIR